MIGKDYDYLISNLTKRIAKIEELVEGHKEEINDLTADWDNATLMRKWNISKRTVANYRAQGLGYFKRGGRVYYSYQDRINFLKSKNFYNGRN